jgi:P27 family predicted phage terminase small subunit
VTAESPVVVSKATTRTAIAKPPAGLSASSRVLWKKLTAEYELDSVAQLELLVTALRSRDIAEAARRTLQAEGLTTKDKYGRPKAHPAATILRDQQAAYVNVLRVLGFPGAG